MSGPVALSGVSAAISNRVVRVISEHTGRGPTKSRTYISDDLVTVVLQDTLTRGERTLVADDRRALVLEVRSAYQDAMRTELVAAVEEITGRSVIAFFSDSQIDPDAAIQAFLLAPADGHGPARDGNGRDGAEHDGAGHNGSAHNGSGPDGSA